MAFSLFPAFFEKPKKIRFSTQESDENIELFLRQHWITNVGWIVTAILGLLAPLILVQFSSITGLNLRSQIPFEIQILALILWYLLILAFIIERYLFWYFNIYIVTDKHLVDIDFHNLLSIDNTEIRLDDVQSARSTFRGILEPLFNFGDVIIKTAAELQDIEFIAVPKPEFVKDKIQDLQQLQENGGNDVG